jgi:hypothetical protein
MRRCDVSQLSVAVIVERTVVIAGLHCHSERFPILIKSAERCLASVQEMRAAVYLLLAAARVVLSLAPSSNPHQSRSRFLSSTAAAFFASGVVMSSDPESCSAMENPRYIDRELEMKYAEDKNGNPRTRGMLVRRFTGDSTPYSFPVSPVRLVKEWPEEPPFKPEDFFRADEIDDGSFYAVPRLVYHIDEPAVASLTQVRHVQYVKRQCLIQAQGYILKFLCYVVL